MSPYCRLENKKPNRIPEATKGERDHLPHLLMSATTAGVRKLRDCTLSPSMFQESRRKRCACCLSTTSSSMSSPSFITTDSSLSEVRSITGTEGQDWGSKLTDKYSTEIPVGFREDISTIEEYQQWFRKARKWKPFIQIGVFELHPYIGALVPYQQSARTALWHTFEWTTKVLQEPWTRKKEGKHNDFLTKNDRK